MKKTKNLTAFSRVLSMLLAMAMLLGSAFGTFVFADEADSEAGGRPAISLGEYHVLAGQEFTVNVTLENNPGILSMNLRVGFDERLIFLGAESGEVFEGWTRSDVDETNNGISMSWFKIALESDGSDVRDGVIARLTFRAAEDLSSGTKIELSLPLLEDAIGNDDLATIPLDNFDLNGGCVTVLDYLPGDVNGDGKVNLPDAIMVLRAVANWKQDNFNALAADVDANGRINLIDALQICKYYNSGGNGVVLLPSPTTPEEGCKHKNMQYFEPLEARPDHNGHFEHYMCHDCGTYFLDAAATRPVKEEDIVIPPHDHGEHFGAYVVATPATETTDGEQYRDCQFEKCNFREYSVIPSLNGVWNGNTQLQGYEGLDFGGQTFYIAGYKDSADGYDTERDVYSNGTDLVSEAANLRTQRVKELYHCDVTFLGADSPVTYVDAMSASGSSVDLVAQKYHVASTSPSGKYYNLYALDMDMSRDWWNQNYVDTYTVTSTGGTSHLYAAFGDFSATSYDSVYAVFYNTAIYNDLIKNATANKNTGATYGDIHDWVINGEWTWDVFMQMLQLATVNGGDESVYDLSDSGDTFGWLQITSTRLTPFAAATGLSIIANNGGSFTFAMAGNTNRWLVAGNRIAKMANADGTIVLNYKEGVSRFAEGRGLFYTEVLGKITALNEEMEGGFGLLPYPKLDVAQERYATGINGHATTYSIPTSVSNVHEVADFFTVWAAHSSAIVRPAWEEEYKGYLADDGSKRSLDILIDGIHFEPDYDIFGSTITTDLYQISGWNALSRMIERQSATIDSKITNYMTQIDARSAEEFVHSRQAMRYNLQNTCTSEDGAYILVEICSCGHDFHIENQGCHVVFDNEPVYDDLGLVYQSGRCECGFIFEVASVTDESVFPIERVYNITAKKQTVDESGMTVQSNVIIDPETNALIEGFMVTAYYARHRHIEDNIDVNCSNEELGSSTLHYVYCICGCGAWVDDGSIWEGHELEWRYLGDEVDGEMLELLGEDAWNAVKEYAYAHRCHACGFERLDIPFYLDDAKSGNDCHPIMTWIRIYRQVETITREDGTEEEKVTDLCSYICEEQIDTHQEYNETAELKDPNAPCDQGLIIHWDCKACGESGDYESWDHFMTVDWEWDISNVPVLCKTENGQKFNTIHIYDCPCGLWAGGYETFCANRVIDESRTGEESVYDEKLGRDILSVYTTYVCEDCESVWYVATLFDNIQEPCKGSIKAVLSLITGDGSEFYYEGNWRNSGYHRTTEGHTEVQDVDLAEGSTSCEDGVFLQMQCIDCGLKYQTKRYEHIIAKCISRSPWTYDSTACGASGAVSVYACACGKAQDISHFEVNCKLIQSGEPTTSTGEDGYNHAITNFVCEAGCGLTMTKDVWSVFEADGSRIDYTKETFYFNDELCGMVTAQNYVEIEHPDPEPEVKALSYTVLDEEAGTCEITGLGTVDLGETNGVLTIPTEIDGYTVVSIGERAFMSNRDIKELVFEEGSCVTQILKDAFVECSMLTTVTLRDGLTKIGEGAFAFTGITEIVIPASVKTLDQAAFFTCQSLTKITLNEGLESIGVEAFYRSGLTEIVIPSSVQSIGTRAFLDSTQLSKVVLNEGLTKLANEAFRHTGITAVTIPASLKDIGERAFMDSTQLSKVVFNYGLRSIENDAFRNTGITSLTIPASVKVIGNGTFAACKNLKSVTFAEAAEGQTLVMTTLGIDTFRQCSGLTNVTLREGISQIGERAFANTGITAIVVPASVTKIVNNPFLGCARLTEITVAEGQKNYTAIDGVLYSAKDGNPTQLISYPICKTGESFTVPKGVTSIGVNAFSHTSITAVTIPASVTTISDLAFFDCKSLTTVILNEGLDAIGDCAFEASAITSIQIPASVTKIGINPFLICTQLTEITVAEGQKNYTAIDGVLYSAKDGNPTQLVSYPMGKAAESFTVPEGVTSIGVDAFSYSAVTAVTLPASMMTLQNFAFFDCENLTTVTLNEGLEYIGVEAFALTAISEITIPASVTTIDENAFADCAEGFTIHAPSGSAAEAYAKDYGIPFVSTNASKE